MNKFPLFLSDFKSFVRSTSFKAEENLHPVFYFEDDEFIRFYKPVGYVVYTTTILKSEELPEGVNIRDLKLEFKATELPNQPDKANSFKGVFL